MCRSGTYGGFDSTVSNAWEAAGSLESHEAMTGGIRSDGVGPGDSHRDRQATDQDSKSVSPMPGEVHRDCRGTRPGKLHGAERAVRIKFIPAVRKEPASVTLPGVREDYKGRRFKDFRTPSAKQGDGSTTCRAGVAGLRSQTAKASRFRCSVREVP